jgi:hypothetical protein
MGAFATNHGNHCQWLKHFARWEWRVVTFLGLNVLSHSSGLLTTAQLGPLSASGSWGRGSQLKVSVALLARLCVRHCEPWHGQYPTVAGRTCVCRDC